LARVSILLTIVTLVAVMVGCIPTQLSLTISSTEGGSVTTPGEGTFTYYEAEVVELVAEADEGSVFDGWTGDVDTIANVSAAITTITVNGDYDITANFAEAVIFFADPNLETAIREALNKPSGPIYASDLAGLTSLSTDWEGIQDLSGLQYCTNLTDLSLEGNQISDISLLAELTSLTDLNLYDNQIGDISPLTGLTGLTGLNLYGNQISDISPLANLTNLTYLSLAYNQIIGISPLVNLTNLTELELGYNQISDISPLANLTDLTYLGVDSNQIGDISPLANLTNLTVLYLASNQISDISPLTNLTNLTYLDLDSNEIRDISPLVENEGLSEGDYLCLTKNPLSSDSVNVYIPQLQVRGVTVPW
jgi:Leucine-rich repeat (LRR) protein